MTNSALNQRSLSAVPYFIRIVSAVVRK